MKAETTNVILFHDIRNRLGKIQRERETERESCVYICVGLNKKYFGTEREKGKLFRRVEVHRYSCPIFQSYLDSQSLFLDIPRWCYSRTLPSYFVLFHDIYCR